MEKQNIRRAVKIGEELEELEQARNTIMHSEHPYITICGDRNVQLYSAWVTFLLEKINARITYLNNEITEL